MKPKLKVWVTFGELKFGDGRARLLEAIDEQGSLRKAAEAFEMSYRNAWGYLRELERAAGFKFVERAPGGVARMADAPQRDAPDRQGATLPRSLSQVPERARRDRDTAVRAILQIMTGPRGPARTA